MDFGNSTKLDSERLRRLFLQHTHPYRHDRLKVRVRYSRGADFSGSCFYRHRLIYINIGRHNVYPYAMGTHIAKAKSNRTHWWRDVYRVILADAEQLALFVYLHELYHVLVKQAGRSPRRKEGMCDRFATRRLVDYFGCPVVDESDRPVARETWDFKDLDQFVAAAPRQKIASPDVPRAIPVTIHGLPDPSRINLWGELIEPARSAAASRRRKRRA